MSTKDRIDLVSSYFHFAGTPYSESETGTGTGGGTGTKPGELFEGIESLVIVPEGTRVDPLWVVRARRRGEVSVCVCV